MPPTETLLPFLATALLVELTPGPNMGFLLLVAGREGWRRGMITVAGITAGLAIYLLASLFGLAEITAQAPWLYQVLRWGGVAYLVWLAWDAWRDGALRPDDALEIRSRLFVRGLLTNLLNPKAAIFYLTLLPAFVRPGPPSALQQAATLGLIHLGVAVVVHSGLVAGASRAKPLVDGASQASRVWISRGFAVGLLAVAVWVAFTTRS